MARGDTDSGIGGAAAIPADEGMLDPAAKLVVLMGGLIASLAISAIASVLPQIDHDLARTPADHLLVKQLVGSVALAMVVGSALAGFVVDRIGIRRVLIGSALLYALGGTAGLYLADLGSLLVSRLLVGVGAAAVQLTCITLVNTRLHGIARARWIGLHISVAMLAAILVHPIAGSMGEMSWRLPFALYALGIAIIPAALSLPHVAAPAPVATMAAEMPSGRSWPPAWFPVRYLLFGFAIGTLALMPTVQVPFLLKARGLTHPSSIAIVLTADSIAAAGMAMLYGRARMHLSIYAAFTISFGAATIGLAVAALARGIVDTIAGLLIYGLGVGWFVPNLMTSLAARLPPQEQGRGAGIVKAAHFLAAPVAVALVEPVARTYGPPGTLFVAAVLALACFLVAGFRLLRR